MKLYKAKYLLYFLAAMPIALFSNVMEVTSMKIESPSFKNNETIPRHYTCEGEDLIPPLEFSDLPTNTKSLAIIVDDPDAPMGTFVHWVAWNFKPNISSIEEGTIGPMEGRNDFGQYSYRGPCPPPGKPHRYFFKLYALDTVIELPEGAAKEELLRAMEGHIIDQAELIGIFER